jgi:hypothetical protein
LFTDALNGCAQPFTREWLQEIVDRIHFKSPHCVLIIGSGKDDAGHLRRRLAAESSHNVKSVHARHMDIEEQELGIGGAHQLDRLERRCGLADDFDIVFVTKQLAQLLASQDFIICDDCVDHHTPNLVTVSRAV